MLEPFGVGVLAACACAWPAKPNCAAASAIAALRRKSRRSNVVVRGMQSTPDSYAFSLTHAGCWRVGRRAEPYRHFWMSSADPPFGGPCPLRGRVRQAPQWQFAKAREHIREPTRSGQRCSQPPGNARVVARLLVMVFRLQTCVRRRLPVPAGVADGSGAHSASPVPVGAAFSCDNYCMKQDNKRAFRHPELAPK